MKNLLKSYHAYASWGWRLVMMVIFPVFLLAAELVAGLAQEDEYPVFYMVMMVWVPIDVFADCWVFGGSCHGKMRYIEYIRTSKRGMHLVRNALWMDMIRRAATMVLLYIPVAAIDIVKLSHSQRIMRLGMEAEVLLIDLCIILFVLNIVRHFNMRNYYAAASMISVMLSGWTTICAVMIGIISGEKMPKDWIVRFGGMLALLVAVCIGLMLFTVWQVMYYVRAGYRDAD